MSIKADLSEFFTSLSVRSTRDWNDDKHQRRCNFPRRDGIQGYVDIPALHELCFPLLPLPPTLILAILAWRQTVFFFFSLSLSRASEDVTFRGAGDIPDVEDGVVHVHALSVLADLRRNALTTLDETVYSSSLVLLVAAEFTCNLGRVSWWVGASSGQYRSRLYTRS